MNRRTLFKLAAALPLALPEIVRAFTKSGKFCLPNRLPPVVPCRGIPAELTLIGGEPASCSVAVALQQPKRGRYAIGVTDFSGPYAQLSFFKTPWPLVSEAKYPDGPPNDYLDYADHDAGAVTVTHRIWYATLLRKKDLPDFIERLRRKSGVIEVIVALPPLMLSACFGGVSTSVPTIVGAADYVFLIETHGLERHPAVGAGEEWVGRHYWDCRVLKDSAETLSEEGYGGPGKVVRFYNNGSVRI